jgi:hypothetical protein
LWEKAEAAMETEEAGTERAEAVLVGEGSKEAASTAEQAVGKEDCGIQAGGVGLREEVRMEAVVMAAVSEVVAPTEREGGAREKVVEAKGKVAEAKGRAEAEAQTAEALRAVWAAWTVDCDIQAGVVEWKEEAWTGALKAEAWTVEWKGEASTVGWKVEWAVRTAGREIQVGAVGLWEKAEAATERAEVAREKAEAAMDKAEAATERGEVATERGEAAWRVAWTEEWKEACKEGWKEEWKAVLTAEAI